MKRRFFLTQAAGSAAVLTQGSAVDVKKPTPLVLTPPVVMAPRTDGLEIVWGVSRHARGWVELNYGKEIRHFGATSFGFTPQGDKVLRVRLDGLEQDEVISYRTVTEAMAEPAARHESEWRELYMMDVNAKVATFAVWNDTHQNEQTIRGLLDLTPASDFLLWNGDICNDWHKEESLMPTLLHPAGTDFTSFAPLAFVCGNHDLRGPYGFRLSDYVATPSGRSYYAFRTGPLAVVCLNTGEDKPDDHPSFKGRVACEPLRREQAAWLHDHVLATPELRDAPYRIVFCHIPLRWKDESEAFNRDYDWYSKRSRDLWHDALVQWGAQVIVSGHTHEHHWLPATKEFPYAQMIGGGPKPESATFIRGLAKSGNMTLTMQALDETVLMKQEFAPYEN